MTLRRALYDSRNIPTIKLGMQVGEQNVIDEARRFGITTDVRAGAVDPHRCRPTWCRSR